MTTCCYMEHCAYHCDISLFEAVLNIIDENKIVLCTLVAFRIIPPWLRRCRSGSAELPHRCLLCLLGVGRISRRGRAGQGVRLRQFLESRRSQYTAANGQGRGELYEFATHPHGSQGQRIFGGCAFDVNGYVGEGSGENIFVVMNGTIHTPPLANSALPGITRDSVLTLCPEAGISVIEQMLPRETLYIADEVFFSGTAAEITPIRSIDRIKVGAGARGPITKRIQDAFFSITSGKVPDRHGWLSPIGVTNSVAVR